MGQGVASTSSSQRKSEPIAKLTTTMIPIESAPESASVPRRAGQGHSPWPRRHSALPMTDTELKLMARAATTGDSSMPVNG